MTREANYNSHSHLPFYSCFAGASSQYLLLIPNENFIYVTVLRSLTYPFVDKSCSRRRNHQRCFSSITNPDCWHGIANHWLHCATRRITAQIGSIANVIRACIYSPRYNSITTAAITSHCAASLISHNHITYSHPSTVQPLVRAGAVFSDAQHSVGSVFGAAL